MKRRNTTNLCMVSLIMTIVFQISSINVVSAQTTSTTSSTTSTLTTSTTTTTTLSPIEELSKFVTDSLGKDRTTITLFVVTALNYGLPVGKVLHEAFMWTEKTRLNNTLEGRGQVIIVDPNGKDIFNVTKYFNRSKTELGFPHPENVFNQIRVVARVSSNTNAKDGNVIIKEGF